MSNIYEDKSAKNILQDRGLVQGGRGGRGIKLFKSLAHRLRNFSGTRYTWKKIKKKRDYWL